MNTTELVQREVATQLDRQHEEDESYNVRTGIMLAAGLVVLVAALTLPRGGEPAISFSLASVTTSGLATLLLVGLLRPSELEYPPKAADFARDLDFWPPLDATRYLYALAYAQLEAVRRNNGRLRRKVFWLVLASTMAIAGAVLLVLQVYASR